MLKHAEPALKKCLFAFSAWVWRTEISGKAIEKLLRLLFGFRPRIRPLYATQIPVYIRTMFCEMQKTSKFHLLFWNKTCETQSCQLAESSAAYLKKGQIKREQKFWKFEFFIWFLHTIKTFELLNSTISKNRADITVVGPNIFPHNWPKSSAGCWEHCTV